MPYKVLLVDDDHFASSGLRLLVDWKGLGFEIIGEAPDGMKALSMIDYHRPDVVITDMYMRYCDGLQLMKRARETGQTPKFIMLSCYDNFEYVKKSLLLGASNYLLKSSESLKDDLVQSLIAVRRELNGGTQTAKGAKPFAKQEFIRELLTGDINEGEITYGMQRLKFNALSGEFFVFAVKSPGLNDASNRILDIMTSTIKPFGHSQTLLFLPDLGISIVEAKRQSHLTRGMALLVADRMRARLQKNCNQRFTLVVCGPTQVTRLKEAYATIEACMEHDMLLYSSAMDAGEFQKNQKAPTFVSHFDELCKSVMSEEKFQKLLQTLFENAKKSGSQQAYHTLYKDITDMHNHLLQSLEPCDCQPMELSDLMHRTIDDAYAVALAQTSKLRLAVSEQQGTAPRKLVRDIINHINSNYTSNVTLDELAQLTNFNKYYICKRFKEETGVNINNYLSAKRIEKAKELISSGADFECIYQVGQAVGFNDASYFNRIFKKITGMTPREYGKAQSDKPVQSL